MAASSSQKRPGNRRRTPEERRGRSERWVLAKKGMAQITHSTRIERDSEIALRSRDDHGNLRDILVD